MFTGIIEELGEVKNISKRGKVTLLEVKTEKISADTVIGDSVAVNGACLTVINKSADTLSFEVMSHTLSGTDLGSLRPKDKVNLEGALKIGDKVSGHFVSGHVDCTGIIRKKNYIDDNLSFEIAAPVSYLRYILDKGSISVDGISLTIAHKKSTTFCVYIIPHTLKNTTLGFKGPSDKVNLEFDILVKSATAHAAR